VTGNTAMVKAQSRRVARMRRRRVLGIVAVTIDVSAERIAELRAAGKLPTDFDGLSLAEKKEALRRALEG
jgi:hypothetical protein